MALRQNLSVAKRMVTFNAGTKIGFTIAAIFVLTSIVEAIGGRSVLPYSPTGISINNAFLPPSLAHPFGTNYIGTVLLSMIIAGAPNDAMVSFFVVVFAFVFGGFVGALAGYLSGWADEALMRVTDVFFAIPALILAIAIVARLGSGLLAITFALIIVWWPSYARLSRGETLKVAHQNYIEAAKTSGFGTVRIVLSHVIPNIFLTLVVYFTLDLGTVVIFYAGLSYLGLSIPPPAPDWGYMVSNYQDYLISAPYLPVIPGLTIALSAIGFALLGDGFRDALEVV